MAHVTLVGFIFQSNYGCLHGVCVELIGEENTMAVILIQTKCTDRSLVWPKKKTNMHTHDLCDLALLLTLLISQSMPSVIRIGKGHSWYRILNIGPHFLWEYLPFDLQIADLTHTFSISVCLFNCLCYLIVCCSLLCRCYRQRVRVRVGVGQGSGTRQDRA